MCKCLHVFSENARVRSFPRRMEDFSIQSHRAHGRHWVLLVLNCVWNVMAHAQKPDFVFRRNGQVHLNRRGHQFSRLLAAEVCASAVVMVDAPCSEVAWRVLATHSIRQFPLHLPSRASPCVITFQLDSTTLLAQHKRKHVQCKAGIATCRTRQTGRVKCFDVGLRWLMALNR